MIKNFYSKINYSISIKNIDLGDDLGKYNTMIVEKENQITNYPYYNLSIYLGNYINIINTLFLPISHSWLHILTEFSATLPELFLASSRS